MKCLLPISKPISNRSQVISPNTLVEQIRLALITGLYKNSIGLEDPRGGAVKEFWTSLQVLNILKITWLLVYIRNFMLERNQTDTTLPSYENVVIE